MERRTLCEHHFFSFSIFNISSAIIRIPPRENFRYSRVGPREAKFKIKRCACKQGAGKYVAIHDQLSYPYLLLHVQTFKINVPFKFAQKRDEGDDKNRGESSSTINYTISLSISTNRSRKKCSVDLRPSSLRMFFSKNSRNWGKLELKKYRFWLKIEKWKIITVQLI